MCINTRDLAQPWVQSVFCDQLVVTSLLYLSRAVW